jgi:hypothetical protein
MVRQIEDQVEDDGKGNMVSAIGKEGKMGWAAYAQLNQTILGAMSQLTSLVANHGAAFIPKEQRGEPGEQNSGRPSVNITVTLAPPRVVPPVDTAEAPSADPAPKP